MINFDIDNRFTGEALFTSEIDCDEKTSHGIKLGLAVKAALEAGADLTDANLTGADLIDADLIGANLTGACLTYSNLRGANLTDATFKNTVWTGGVIINRQPIRIQGLGPWLICILDEHMQIGCEIHSYKDWAEFDDRQIAQMDGCPTLEFWKQNRQTLLELAKADGRGVDKGEAA